MPNSPTTPVPEDDELLEILYGVANFYSMRSFKLDGTDYEGVDEALERIKSYGDRRELEGRKLGSSALKDQLSMRYFSDVEFLDELSYELHEYHKVLESQKEKNNE